MKDQTCRSRWNFSELVSTSGLSSVLFQITLSKQSTFSPPPEPNAKISFCFLGPNLLLNGKTKWSQPRLCALLPWSTVFVWQVALPTCQSKEKGFFFCFKSRHYFQNLLQRLTMQTRERLWSRCLSPARGGGLYVFSALCTSSLCAADFLKKKTSIIHGRQDFAGWLRQH